MALKKRSYKTGSVLEEMWQEAYQNRSTLSFKIISGSMSPMIEVGNVVMVSKAEPSRVCIGDIMAFQDGQSVVVHRVIGKIRSDQQLSFRHRGDAGAAEGIFSSRHLIGKVLVIKKEGREISLTTPWYIMSNRILGWRLRLKDDLGKMQSRFISIMLHQALRPIWKLYRYLLLSRLREKRNDGN